LGFVVYFFRWGVVARASERARGVSASTRAGDWARRRRRASSFLFSLVLLGGRACCCAREGACRAATRYRSVFPDAPRSGPTAPEGGAPPVRRGGSASRAWSCCCWWRGAAPSGRGGGTGMVASAATVRLLPLRRAVKRRAHGGAGDAAAPLAAPAALLLLPCWCWWCATACGGLRAGQEGAAPRPTAGGRTGPAIRPLPALPGGRGEKAGSFVAVPFSFCVTQRKRGGKEGMRGNVQV